MKSALKVIALLSATLWVLSATLTHPKLVELSQSMNLYAAWFGLAAAWGVMIMDEVEEWSKLRQGKKARQSAQVDALFKGNPQTAEHMRMLDNWTKPDKE